MSSIKFNADGSINFGDYTLTFTDEGFEFDGAILAAGFDASPSQAQGSVSGYTSGGYTNINTIDKFSFVADANATDVGDLLQGRGRPAGQSSTVSGYTSGGATRTPPFPAVEQSTIDKFPFAADGNATNVGNLTQARQGVAGQSSTSRGYTSGGIAPPAVVPNQVNTIDRFPFAANINATDVGDLLYNTYYLSGQSSRESGYISGARNTAGANVFNIIEKFPFASDSNVIDVGTLTQARQTTAGQNSGESGYTSGGAPNLTTIDKFPFATDLNATDVGDLTQGRSNLTGQSSTESGYSSAGSGLVNTIDKFPFAADANATDVGDLTLGRQLPAGQQV